MLVLSLMMRHTLLSSDKGYVPDDVLRGVGACARVR